MCVRVRVRRVNVHFFFVRGCGSTFSKQSELKDRECARCDKHSLSSHTHSPHSCARFGTLVCALRREGGGKLVGIQGWRKEGQKEKEQTLKTGRDLLAKLRLVSHAVEVWVLGLRPRHKTVDRGHKMFTNSESVCPSPPMVPCIFQGCRKGYRVGVQARTHATMCQ